MGGSAALAETRVALVVGNSAYQSTTPLANPLNDARDMAAALKAVGFDVVEALDADRRKLDGALRAFTDKLAKADVALFFYAGHGLQVGPQNYLVPVDAKLERERDLEFEAVRLEFVLRQMEIDREGQDHDRHPRRLPRQSAHAQSRPLDGDALGRDRPRPGGGLDRARHLHRLLDAARQRGARRPGAQLAVHGRPGQAHGRPRGATCRPP